MDNVDSKEYILFPEVYTRRELNALYRKIPLEDKVIRLLRRYLLAMAHLYGVISLKDAYGIINEQNPSLLSLDEFEAFSNIAKHEEEDFYIMGDEDFYKDHEAVKPLDRKIIDVYLIHERPEAFFDVLWSQSGKPLYIPKKRDLLRYENEEYCEPSPYAAALIEFFRTDLQMEEDKAKRLFYEIMMIVKSGFVSHEEIMQTLDAFHVQLKIREAERFFSLYNDYHNNARMQCNRGFSPNELVEMQPPEDRIPKSLTIGPNIMSALQSGEMDASELRQSFLTMEMPSEELRASLLSQLDSIPSKAQTSSSPSKKTKVGRNEPCPCGSGKKYKKCCGR